MAKESEAIEEGLEGIEDELSKIRLQTLSSIYVELRVRNILKIMDMCVDLRTVESNTFKSRFMEAKRLYDEFE